MIRCHPGQMVVPGGHERFRPTAIWWSALPAGPHPALTRRVTCTPNFALSAAGESVLLSSPGGAAVLDTITFPAQDEDLAYGRTTGRRMGLHRADAGRAEPGRRLCRLVAPPAFSQTRGVRTHGLFADPDQSESGFAALLLARRDRASRRLHRADRHQRPIVRCGPRCAATATIRRAWSRIRTCFPRRCRPAPT